MKGVLVLLLLVCVVNSSFAKNEDDKYKYEVKGTVSIDTDKKEDANTIFQADPREPNEDDVSVEAEEGGSSSGGGGGCDNCGKFPIVVSTAKASMPGKMGGGSKRPEKTLAMTPMEPPKKKGGNTQKWSSHVKFVVGPRFKQKDLRGYHKTAVLESVPQPRKGVGMYIERVDSMIHQQTRKIHQQTRKKNSKPQPEGAAQLRFKQKDLRGYHKTKMLASFPEVKKGEGMYVAEKVESTIPDTISRQHEAAKHRFKNVAAEPVFAVNKGAARLVPSPSAALLAPSRFMEQKVDFKAPKKTFFSKVLHVLSFGLW